MSVNGNVVEGNRKSYGLCGLQNIGNTCYMNTIIQCMSNCQLFREYLIHKKFVEPLASNITDKFKEGGKECDIQTIHNEFNNTLTYQLYRVIKTLWRANDCVLTIDTFKNLFGNKIKMFYGYAQHDTQEALNSLFMTIENEVNVKGEFSVSNICPNVRNLMDKRDCYTKYIQDNNLTDEQIKLIFGEYDQYKKNNPLAVRGMEAYKSWKIYNKNNRNIIADVFTGYYHVETACPQCGYISDKFESFNCLPLTIVKDEKEDNSTNHKWKFQNNCKDVDIYDCLDEFCKTEKLDNDNKWFCSKCNDKVNATRKFYIWEKPKVLIILLKRFDYAKHHKTSNKVNFLVNDFDISKYDSNLNKMESNNKKYDLFAVGNHRGNMFGGHHFSYCKNRNGWYEFNDDTVKQIIDFRKNDKTKQIVTNGAYLLFYELQS